MKEQIKRCISIMIIVAAIIFIMAVKIEHPYSIWDWVNCFSYAMTASGVALLLYDVLLWRFDPTNGVPVLGKYYIGYLESTFKESDCSKTEKVIRFKVKQHFLGMSIISETATTRSVTVQGSIIRKNSSCFLVYTYETIPPVIEYASNPIQYGTACFLLMDNNNLKGNYWTNRHTLGIISVKKCGKADWENYID